MNRQFSFRWTTIALLVVVSSTMVTLTAAGVSKGVPGRDRLRKLHSELGSSAEPNSDSFEAPMRTAVQRSVLPGKRRNLADSTGEECPVDLSDLSAVRFAITDTCSGVSRPTISDTWPPTGPAGATGPSACCNIVQISYGILQAQWTATSGFFRLENEAVLRTCISEYTQRIEVLDTDLHVETCFHDSFYRNSNRQISWCKARTVEEYTAKLENSTVVESARAACNDDLLQAHNCVTCQGATNQMLEQVIDGTEKLDDPDGNLSLAIYYDCLYATVTYISAILDEKGPADPGMQTCLYVMPLPPSGGGSNDAGLIAGVTVAGVLLSLMVAASLLWWSKERRGSAVGPVEPRGSRRPEKPTFMSGKTAGVTFFSYEELQKATDDFSAENHVGSGGFGSVYKGVMPDGTAIAVKRLKNFSREGETEFLNEIQMINRVRHRNLVRLRGCCVVARTGDYGHQRLLVYDFLPGGSLTDHLFPDGSHSGCLSWPQRSRIAVNIARGLAYLHNDTAPPIFHRDIKASNVLLNHEFNACVADFGLAKLTLEGQSHITASSVAGTHGYMAPEYAMYGKLTDKSDVYSFGVLLLEIMSGRKALDKSQIATSRFLISDWCWEVVESAGSVVGVIDERIREGTNPQVLTVQERFVITGMLCSHSDDAMRPTMAEARIYLEGDKPVPKLPSRPASLYTDAIGFKKYLEDSTTGCSGTVTKSFPVTLPDFSVEAEAR